MAQKKNSLTAVVCLLLVVLLLGWSTSAVALQQNGLTITKDTMQGNLVDTASSATSNQPSKPSKPSNPSKPASPSTSSGTSSSSPSITYTISKEDAIKLAKANLNADDTWGLTYEQLTMDGGNAVYLIILTDPVGDAHLRRVDANTGEVTVQSLWDFFTGNKGAAPESYTDNNKTESNDNQDQQEYENDEDDGENEGDLDAKLSFSWMAAQQTASGIAGSNLFL